MNYTGSRKQTAFPFSKNFFYHSCNIAGSTFVKPNKPTRMRKVFINKWFLLAATLTLSLSAASFISYKKAERVCTVSNEDSGVPGTASKGSEMLWEVISRQFTPFISVQ
jgi:hypothetical protein